MRIATFNCENLFARYNFKHAQIPTETDGFTVNDLAFDILNDEEKRITACAIKETDADVIGLQEVESLAVVDRFVSQHLNGQGYEHKILIDSHDPRGIDVALISRYPIVSIRTHRDEKSQDGRTNLFSRDCLEVQIDVDGKFLYVYVNHFKSMIGGRDETFAKRKAQAERVAELIEVRWKPSGYSGNFVVLGDLNDYPDASTSLTALLQHPGLVSIIQRLPETEQWTHYYARGNEYQQLDYLFLSKALAEHNSSSIPVIMRKGLPCRATRYSGVRCPGVGLDNPKASDHAPVYIDLSLI